MPVLDQPPPDCLRVTVWAAWVLAAADRESRGARLAIVPEIMRDQVRQECVWYFQRIKRPAV